MERTKFRCLERTKERIKKILGKVELSVSAYDTAWVGMIPSANSPQYPLFPQCLNWLLENQLFDGSWGSHDRHPLLMKDTISSTLACVLALKRWGISEEQINRGLQFIKSSFASVDDEKQCSPIGFDIIFPSLIERAHRLELKLPLGGRNLDIFTHKRVGAQKVNHALRFPYDANLDRLLHQRSIELYNVDQKRISKTSYSSLNLGNEEFLKLAMEDFNIIQSMHGEEYKQFNRWVVESRLDKLEFGRQKQVYCYLTAAVTLPSPELSDVRVSWAKNTLFIAIIDYLFDVWGSEEEQINLVQLVEKWNVDISKECCSERVEILFSALQNTICEIAEKAYKLQGRSVMSHLIEIWLDLLQSWLKEAEWSKSKYVPTIDEYMANAWVSAAVGPNVIPVLYLIGPKLSKETVQSAEYNSLFELTSIIGRLLNDINSFKREFEQGRLNAVTLQVINGSGSVTEEEIIKEIDDLITKK